MRVRGLGGSCQLLAFTVDFVWHEIAIYDQDCTETHNFNQYPHCTENVPIL